MGYFKQLHIDCNAGTCEANDFETCYMQPENPSYSAPNPDPSDGDYDPYFDHDRDDTN